MCAAENNTRLEFTQHIYLGDRLAIFSRYMMVKIPHECCCWLSQYIHRLLMINIQAKSTRKDGSYRREHDVKLQGVLSSLLHGRHIGGTYQTYQMPCACAR